MISLQATAQKIRFCDTSNKWSHPFCDWGTGTPSIWCSGSSSWYVEDTVISGINYHQIHTNNPASQSTIAVVREDTLLNKVYFRLLYAVDTTEHILYDYNLDVGDTLKIDFQGKHFRYKIDALDSVQMAGLYYKRWQTTTGLGRMYLIEGIGTNMTPMAVIYPNTFENSNQLQCFSNNGLRHRCKPSTPVMNPQPNSPNFFDNDSSCVKYSAPPDEVGSLQSGSKPRIVPNPGGKEAMLILPSTTGHYSLTIRDVVGRVVSTVRQSCAQQQPIGTLLQTEGLYFYSLQLENGQRLSGRFQFR